MSWRSNVLWRVGDRPSSRWSAAVYHLPWVVISGVPLGLSVMARLHQLPKVPCGFLRLTGYPCPTCGYTRTFCALSEGQVVDAVVNAPVAVVLYVFLLGILCWNGAALMLGRRVVRGPWLSLSPFSTRLAWWLCGLAILINWGYRILAGLR